MEAHAGVATTGDADRQRDQFLVERRQHARGECRLGQRVEPLQGFGHVLSKGAEGLGNIVRDGGEGLAHGGYAPLIRKL